MRAVTLPAQALAWLGRQGTRAVAISALLGLMLPQLSALFRPFVEEAIFVLLVLAFLRVEPSAVLAHIRRPWLLLSASLWMLVILPVGLGLVLRESGVLAGYPDLALAAFIVTAAPPIMSAPAFIALIGLDAALALALICITMLLTPLTAPLIGTFILGDVLPIDAPALALRLGLLLAASAGLAYALRRLTGGRRIAAAQAHIDGLNVLILFVFAVAVMDGVSARFQAAPLLTVGIAALTFAVALFQMGVTMLAFSASRRDQAFVVAHAAGNRNMGLIVAALGGSLPDLAWLYFGLAQLPIYLLPWLLGPLAARLRASQ
ncbi:sodium:proton symporter [Stappia indica]|uniref:sodium:proton symporter n=1 Tax=Stappia indica TaxID=538381 RepID=UPI001CD745CA|nr:sodium:proton symporter [Stappia indica]MCA1299996.1 sodium:proton symporter [Stappia indica]